jgi:hypothetical protein
MASTSTSTTSSATESTTHASLRGKHSEDVRWINSTTHSSKGISSSGIYIFDVMAIVIFVTLLSISQYLFGFINFLELLLC